MFYRCLIAFIFSFSLFSVVSAQHGGARHPGLAPGPAPVSLTDYSTAEVLIPFSKHGIWGFMRPSGEVVIPPNYPKVGNFHEGLSAVRFKSGLYGYINDVGTVIIPGRFDKAFAFQKDVALAFTDTIPCIVHRNGKVIPLVDYTEVFNAQFPKRWIVKSRTGIYGLINDQGQLILDTLYTRITPFQDGLTVISRRDDAPIPNISNGVADAEGLIVVPIGKYQIYGTYQNGVVAVSLDSLVDGAEINRYGLMDIHGKLIFTEFGKNYTLRYGKRTIYDGNILIVEFENPDIDPDSEGDEAEIIGAVNLQGDVLFRNPDIERITSFSDGRAFTQTERGWNLINQKGEVLSPRPYLALYNYTYSRMENCFANGFELVDTEEGWCAIDRNGQVIAGPLYADVEDLVLVENIAFLYASENPDSDSYSSKIGIWDILSDRIIEPQYDDVEWLSPNQKVFKLRRDNKELVIDMTGRVLYQQDIAETIGKLNIDFMNRGYFYAASPRKPKYNGYGGWGGSGNLFSELPKKERTQFADIQIVVSYEPDTVYAGIYLGHRVRLVNGSDSTLVLSAQDSRLYMQVQARDEAGNWKAIEYLPNSWCGNSYHQVYLPKNCFWNFITPAYGGRDKTQLRIQLVITEADKTTRYIYSNVYEGWVNPSQFWCKHDYYPQGIMDPYYD